MNKTELKNDFEELKQLQDNVAIAKAKQYKKEIELMNKYEFTRYEDFEQFYYSYIQRIS